MMFLSSMMFLHSSFPINLNYSFTLKCFAVHVKYSELKETWPIYLKEKHQNDFLSSSPQLGGRNFLPIPKCLYMYPLVCPMSLEREEVVMHLANVPMIAKMPPTAHYSTTKLSTPFTIFIQSKWTHFYNRYLSQPGAYITCLTTDSCYSDLVINLRC